MEELRRRQSTRVSAVAGPVFSRFARREETGTQRVMGSGGPQRGSEPRGSVGAAARESAPFGRPGRRSRRRGFRTSTRQNHFPHAGPRGAMHALDARRLETRAAAPVIDVAASAPPILEQESAQGYDSRRLRNEASGGSPLLHLHPHRPMTTTSGYVGNWFRSKWLTARCRRSQRSRLDHSDRSRFIQRREGSHHGPSADMVVAVGALLAPIRERPLGDGKEFEDAQRGAMASVGRPGHLHFVCKF